MTRFSSACSTRRTLPRAPDRGFTLVEVVFAAAILGITGMGIISAFLQSRRVAESNIFETTALTVAQGYLEQIKTTDYQNLETIAGDPATNLLETRGVTHDGSGGTSVVPQMLQVGTRNAIGVFEGAAHKGILIDLQKNTGGTATIPRYMPMWVTPTFTDLIGTAANRRCIEISLLFEWEVRDFANNPVLRQRTIRTVSSDVPSY